MPDQQNTIRQARNQDEGWEDAPDTGIQHTAPAPGGTPTLPRTDPVPEDEPTVYAAPSVDDGEGNGGSGDGGGSSSISPKLLMAGGAVVALLCLVGVVVFALFFPPLNLAGGGGRGCKNLTASRSSATHPDGVTVNLVGEGTAQVCLNSIARELFLDGKSGQEYEGALNAIPSFLEIKSPLYALARQSGESFSTEILIPNAAEPWNTLDLYTWNAEEGRWDFVPSELDTVNALIRTDAAPANVAIFQTSPITPLIATTLDAGETITDEGIAAANIILPTGATLQSNGTLGGGVIGGWELGQGYAVIPVISGDGATVTTVINNSDAIASHIQDIQAFVVGNGYSGIALDYQGLSAVDQAAFAAFITDLGAAMDAANKLLIVMLPVPNGEPGAWDTAGYDWVAIGAASDAVVVNAGIQIDRYTRQGMAYELLNYATTRIQRQKVYLGIPTLSVTADPASWEYLSFSDAVAPLGEIAVTNASEEGFKEGDSVLIDLEGQEENFQPDQATGAYAYTVTLEDSSLRYFWIVLSSTVRARMDFATPSNIGGMVVYDMLSDDADAGVITAVSEYKASLTSTVPNELLIQWSVMDASGATQVYETGVGTPFSFQVAESGDYGVNAALVGSGRTDRGSVVVPVGGAAETPTPTPTQVAVVTQAAATTATQAVTQAATQAAPAPSGAAGSDGGPFETGGQVPNAMVHVDKMQSANMKWVKFQIKWAPGVDPGLAGVYVNAGHSAGFKVLLSIPGPLYPTSIDYGAYVEFLGAVAAAGPDAIEVWNEMNLDREWPAGQIDPASYVNNMLAPAFNKIKSVSPGTMVIIGALAPTGFDNGTNAWSDYRYVQGLAAAGAQKYANCIGAHHNSGTTSPSVRSGRAEGDHYSWYFLPTIEVYRFGMGGTLPVCITEVGYLSPEGFSTPIPQNFSWGNQNSVAEHAAWLGEAASISRGLGWVRMMIVFNVGFTTWDTDPQAGYSIVRPDGSCPACGPLAAGS